MLEFLKNLNWSHIGVAALTAGVPLVCLIVLRAVLDFHLAHWLVKMLSLIEEKLHINSRNYLRERPHNIRGSWLQRWETDSPNYSSYDSRESRVRMYQFGSYCYGEFEAKGAVYVFFGEIIDNHIWGRWYDSGDRLGYFGAHQLEIIDGGRMSGRWIGYSKRNVSVNQGGWDWERDFPDGLNRERTVRFGAAEAKRIKKSKARRLFSNG